jgi:hypothetical protein
MQHFKKHRKHHENLRKHKLVAKLEKFCNVSHILSQQNSCMFVTNIKYLCNIKKSEKNTIYIKRLEILQQLTCAFGIKHKCLLQSKKNIHNIENP